MPPDLLKNIGAAFVGGLILNVMPCVLPVLTMKVFHTIKKAQDDPGSNRRHGVAYAAGVIATFIVFALLVILVRVTLHKSVSWGQQYSNPKFLSAIVALMFVFGLNALGVFEISVGMGGEQAHGGTFGSFVNGAIASVMSTPCSAPFLGVAATYALGSGSTWWQTLTMFVFIGVGLAFPFTVISFVPAAGKLLPKPGAWMETFKQLMGFTLLGASAFFFRALQKQLSIAAANSFLFFLLAIGVALWAMQRFGGFEHGAARRWSVRALTAAASVGAGMGLLTFEKPDAPAAVALAGACEGQPAASGADIPPVVVDGHIKWVPYDEARFKAELARGRPVFADYTADWCANCKTHEKISIETDEIRGLLVKTKILPMKFDCTRDEVFDALTPRLQKLGRDALPVHVIYYPDGSWDLLPEVNPLSGELKRLLAAALEKASEKYPPTEFKPLGHLAAAAPPGHLGGAAPPSQAGAMPAVVDPKKL